MFPKYFSTVPPIKDGIPASQNSEETGPIQEADYKLDHIFELSDYSQWQTHVMDQTVPVILDCHAEWCGPCMTLDPILKEATLNLEGKVKLIKLNVETLPELAKGLNVRSLPSVFLVS